MHLQKSPNNNANIHKKARNQTALHQEPDCEYHKPGRFNHKHYHAPATTNTTTSSKFNHRNHNTFGQSAQLHAQHHRHTSSESYNDALNMYYQQFNNNININKLNSHIIVIILTDCCIWQVHNTDMTACSNLTWCLNEKKYRQKNIC